MEIRLPPLLFVVTPDLQQNQTIDLKKLPHQCRLTPELFELLKTGAIKIPRVATGDGQSNFGAEFVIGKECLGDSGKLQFAEDTIFSYTEGLELVDHINYLYRKYLNKKYEDRVTVIDRPST